MNTWTGEDAKAWIRDWKADPDLRAEFLDNSVIYFAFKRAEAEGLAKIYGRSATRS